MRVRSLTDELDARSGFRRVVGESPEWRPVLKEATQVASTDTTVLLLGEALGLTRHQLYIRMRR